MNSTRTVLEVLKLSSPKDLLLQLSCVCLQWSRLSIYSEVWQAYCDVEDVNATDWPGKSAKEAYRLGIKECDLLIYIRASTVKLIIPRKLSTPEGIETYKLSSNSGSSDDNGYCLLSRYKVIRFGVKLSPEVHSIDLKEGTITPLPPMHVGRSYPGVLLYSKALIYLFAGDTQVCEKYHIPAQRWELIAANLREPITGPIPALYKQRVYLAGTINVEVFYIPGETFTRLSFKMPMVWWYTLGLVDQGELVVVQFGRVGRWMIDSKETGFREIEWKGFSDGYYSNCPPVWYRGELYSLHNSVPKVGGVIAFSPSQNSLRTVITYI